MEWKPIITNDIPLGVVTNVAPTKGNITYEYNPFRNYRISQNMYEYKGELYSLGDLWNNFKITLQCKIIPYYYDKDTGNKQNYNISEKEYDNSNYKEYEIKEIGEIGDWKNSADIIASAFKDGRNSDRTNLEYALKNANNKENEPLGSLINNWVSFGTEKLDENTSPVLREAGELTDFITDELSFDIEHPVQMLPQYSYDGSVNLILIDGVNKPRLINSRFSATGKNTYEVCDRKGNNDTNIYDQGEQFEIDTSLYKSTNLIANIEFKDVLYGGNLKVGNYHFYFKLSDADGNESDFIGESGLVSIFLGSSSYSSVSTGERDENSHKQIQFKLSNLDSSYSYIHVYYSRYTAENDQNRVIEYKQIDKNYHINNAQVANIYISGYEKVIDITADDINLQFNVIDSAYTSAICQNRLFLANVHKPDVPYNELQDLSLRILPYLNTEDYSCDITENYTLQSNNKGYIDPKFIYEKTGYWTEELYRFGIVYILPDNTLTPVFNIRGGCDIGELNDDEQYYTKYKLYDNDKRKYIQINEDNCFLTNTESNQKDSNQQGSCKFENAKGVVSFKSNKDTDTIFSVKMHIPFNVSQELQKYVKGYFFVRQPRIPFILAQGITIGINKESGTPTIPTREGVVDTILNGEKISKTHICVGDDNGNIADDEVVFLSEGFLQRYRFHYETKISGIFKTIGIVLASIVAVVAIAAACVFTCGVAGVGIGAGIGAMMAAGAGAVAGVGTAIGATAAIGIGIGVGATAVTALTVGGAIQISRATTQKKKRKYNRWETQPPAGQKLVENENNSRKLTQDFTERVILTAEEENNICGIICPDFEVDQSHFNNIFIGDEHLIKSTTTQTATATEENQLYYFKNDGQRHFYIEKYYDSQIQKASINAKITTVTDNMKVALIEDMKFRARAGEAEEAFRYECVGDSYKTSETKQSDLEDEETVNNRNQNSDIIRGSFGPYLGFYDPSNQFNGAETVNIYTAGYDVSKLEYYVQQRADDSSVFYTISDRFVWKTDSIANGLNSNKNDIEHNIYRGDCYLCQFTHRINRNFQDPSAPFNDIIIEENTWKDNYESGNSENLDLINLGDVNAIKMGTWVTFRVRSSNNLNIRTQDSSHNAEYSMTNTPRTYFPKSPMSVEGVYKIPESSTFNAGFKKLLSERYNFEVPNVPWIKNWFGTRIMYSNINVSDSFQNGFRVFKGQNYRDYTREYGEITKLISFESSLLCVFEHGVALIPINERTIAGQGQGGFAYINTSNVLPDNPRIISDVYGSQWADSVLKIPGKFGDNIQYVYGVDTVAKKIWRTDGQTLTCISDMKVQEFLNNNITLSEFELTPKLGIRNVKTFYNSYKRDVMFTFYDNTYGFEEKVWNLCWNELLNQFVTFYSWVPSVMENINNIPFSFNRNTTKWISKLGTSHSNSSFADGITLNNVVVNNFPDENGGYSSNYNIPITYTSVDGNDYTINCTVSKDSRKNLIGILNLSNRTIPQLDYLPEITYKLEKDPWRNKELFRIDKVILDDIEGAGYIQNGSLVLPETDGTNYKESKLKGTVTIWGLYFNEKNNPYDLMSEIYYRNISGHSYADTDCYIDTISGESIENKADITNYKNNEKEYFETYLDKPIFKNINGKRLTLDKPYRKDRIVTLLNIKASISYQIPSGINDVDLGEAYYNNISGIQPGSSIIDAGYYESTVAIIPQWNLQFLSTDFWRHGQAGIFDIADKIYPTYWYGEQHPFEFEFIVANDSGKHKIFNNLQIISNKAEPESFHYEIVGECYEFAKDKKNMYIRQEATKELYQYNGSDIVYNHNYTDLTEKRRDLISGYETDDLKIGKVYDKSTLFPLYYGRQDHINEIYDSYSKKNKDIDTKYFQALSGSELILYSNLNEIRIWNHSQAVNVTNPNARLLKGNIQYKEDLWNVQIDPINFKQRNEPDWSNTLIENSSSTKIPVEITNFSIPEDIKDKNELDLPESESFKDRGFIIWPNNIENKQVKVKDKYLKVRVRYSGKDLAVINAINTLYSISYS